MRVLMLAQFYPPVVGGEERHVRNLARGLVALGHDVHVATLDVGGEVQRDPGVTVHLLDNIGRRAPRLYPSADRPLALPVPDPLTTKALAGLVSRLRPDVVHAHNWIINSYVALTAARRLPLVYSLHDYSHVCATKRFMFEDNPCKGPRPSKCLGCAGDHYGRARGTAISAAVRAGAPVRERVVDVFTPVSTAVAVGNGLAGSDLPWRVVPNFVPDALLAQETPPRADALPDGPFLFFAGDLTAQKGAHTLLEAYAALPEATRPALLMVGRPDGTLPDALPDGVHLGQHWPHEDVVSAFHHCLAAVLPSEWPDPCPTTVLEAMASGAPLVTTHQGGIADMVTDGESALVVPPGDPGALTTALARLVADPALRDDLAAGGRQRVTGFLESSVARAFEGIYRDLVTRRG